MRKERIEAVEKIIDKTVSGEMYWSQNKINTSLFTATVTIEGQERAFTLLTSSTDLALKVDGQVYLKMYNSTGASLGDSDALFLKLVKAVKESILVNEASKLVRIDSLLSAW